MIGTRAAAFTLVDVAAADLFQVLSSPIRLAVLRLLLEGERPVGSLMQELEIAQSRLSNHLACLRNCGLVTTRREGNYIYYRVADPRIVRIVELAEDVAARNADELAHCPVIQAER
jgi:DNA-binding transcriptional ArsR family regulator